MASISGFKADILSSNDSIWQLNQTLERYRLIVKKIRKYAQDSETCQNIRKSGLKRFPLNIDKRMEEPFVSYTQEVLYDDYGRAAQKLLEAEGIVNDAMQRLNMEIERLNAHISYCNAQIRKIQSRNA